MNIEKSWRVFLGSFLLLIVSYVVYFARYSSNLFFNLSKTDWLLYIDLKKKNNDPKFRINVK